MDSINTIIIAIFSMTAIGAVCGLMLSVSSKIMAVQEDERVAQIRECLPGSNCGACGYPGCSGYAEALASGTDIKNNLCTPGGAPVVKRLSGILGIEAGDAAAKFAVIRCRGEYGAQKKKMEYKGVPTCMAAMQLFGGEGACAFGCIGYGDCQAVCPSGAICVKNGLARVNTMLCTGCGLCVKACPRKLISVEEDTIETAVLCQNVEKGAAARKKCSNTCLGCGKCARECPAGAIVVQENLARIDYGKCTGCGHCVAICVTGAIRPQAFSRSKEANTHCQLETGCALLHDVSSGKALGVWPALPK